MPRRSLTAALLALAAGGCGGRLAPVEGVVTLDGAPVAGATVSFMPLAAGGEPGSAGTDDAGRFRPLTRQEGGVVPGPYKVVVYQHAAAPGGPPAAGDPETGAAAHVRRAGPVARKNLLPPAYADPSRTPLRVDVPAGGLRDVRLELRAGSR